MSQHSDKFCTAVRVLSGNGPIKKRLVSAYDDNLAHLPAEELPELIRPRFELLRRAMHTVKPLRGESPVLATVRKMSKTETNRCANEIVTMFSELRPDKGTGERNEQAGSKAKPADLLAKRYQSLN